MPYGHARREWVNSFVLLLPFQEFNNFVFWRPPLPDVEEDIASIRFSPRKSPASRWRRAHNHQNSYSDASFGAVDSSQFGHLFSADLASRSFSADRLDRSSYSRSSYLTAEEPSYDRYSQEDFVSSSPSRETSNVGYWSNFSPFEGYSPHTPARIRQKPRRGSLLPTSDRDLGACEIAERRASLASQPYFDGYTR